MAQDATSSVNAADDAGVTVGGEDNALPSGDQAVSKTKATLSGVKMRTPGQRKPSLKLREASAGQVEQDDSDDDEFLGNIDAEDPPNYRATMEPATQPNGRLLLMLNSRHCVT